MQIQRHLLLAIALITTLPPVNFTKEDEVRSSEWFLDSLSIKEAHSISTGAGITIALPDTGIRSHRDFKSNLSGGVDLIESGTDPLENDKVGHGTEMAGIIVGHGHGQSDGVLGIAPESKLIPIKTSNGPGFEPKVAAGISFAIASGAEIINVSSGSGPSQEISQAVASAIDADIVVVAASGNDFRAVKIGYPAALPGVLAVGAIGKDGAVADFSIPGSNVGLCAPGTEIVTTGLNSSYRIVEGTSASTAIVSGAAALVRAKFPSLSAPEVIHRLTATATDIGPPGWDEQCGYGVLNIIKALTADVPPPDGGGVSSSEAASTGVADKPLDKGNQLKVGLLSGIAAMLAGGVFVAFLATRRRNREQL
ncbi:S8 family serine peptidase [Actinoplanes sp. HUAS TT8]|uniref:S8 family serine peptidase n=1 Tax=Actinoplanes sp. HUAS TT8 TaxID=3447453 RepID=UPI003F526DB3